MIDWRTGGCFSAVVHSFVALSMVLWVILCVSFTLELIIRLTSLYANSLYVWVYLIYSFFNHADFIVDSAADIPDEDESRRMHRRPLLPREDEQEDVEALERRIQARYARSNHMEYDEETTEVEQQALLPSVRDPKLWMVKCAV